MPAFFTATNILCFVLASQRGTVNFVSVQNTESQIIIVCDTKDCELVLSYFVGIINV